MNIYQQAQFVEKLNGVRRSIEECRKLVMEAGFLATWELRQTDNSLKAAYDAVDNAMTHLAKPCNSPMPE